MLLALFLVGQVFQPVALPQSIGGNQGITSGAAATGGSGVNSIAVPPDLSSTSAGAGAVTIAHTGQMCNFAGTPCNVTSGWLKGDATGGNVTFNLPASSATQNPISACKTDSSANTVTLHRNGSDTISGAAADFVLTAQHQCVLLVDTSAGNWSVRSERQALGNRQVAVGQASGAPTARQLAVTDLSSIQGTQNNTGPTEDNISIDQTINALSYGKLGAANSSITTATTSGTTLAGATTIVLTGPPSTTSLPQNRWISIPRVGSDAGGGATCAANWNGTLNGAAHWNCNAPSTLAIANVGVAGATSWDYYARIIDGEGGASACIGPTNVANGPTYVSRVAPLKATVGFAAGNVPMYALYRATGGAAENTAVLVGTSVHEVLLDEGQVRQVQDGGITVSVTPTHLTTTSSNSFVQLDVGKTVTGPGVPAGTTIASVTDGENVVLSQAATGADTSGATFVIGAVSEPNIPSTCDGNTYAEDYTGQITAINGSTITVSPAVGANNISSGATVRPDEGPMLQAALDQVETLAFTGNLGTFWLKLPAQPNGSTPTTDYQIYTSVMSGDNGGTRFGIYGVGGDLRNRMAAGTDLVWGGSESPGGTGYSSILNNTFIRDVGFYDDGGGTGKTRLLANGFALIGSQGFDSSNMWFGGFSNNCVELEKNGTSAGVMTKVKFDKLKVTNCGHHGLWAGYGHTLDDLTLLNYFSQASALLVNGNGTNAPVYLGSTQINAGEPTLIFPSVIDAANCNNTASAATAATCNAATANNLNGCYPAALSLGFGAGGVIDHFHGEQQGCGSGTKDLYYNGSTGLVNTGSAFYSTAGNEAVNIAMGGTGTQNDTIINPVHVGATHVATYMVDFGNKPNITLSGPTYQGSAPTNYTENVVASDRLTDVPDHADQPSAAIRYYGDGRDGAGPASGSISTSTKFYTTWAPTGAITAGIGRLIIHATGPVTLGASSSITVNGNVGTARLGGAGGGSGGGTAGGTAGSNLQMFGDGNLKVIQSGGAAGGAGGGNGGAVTALTAGQVGDFLRSAIALDAPDLCDMGFSITTAGGCGGGAGRAGGSSGGALGNAGGLLAIYAPSITIASGATIDVSGLCGGISAGTNTGGGGGGGAGSIWFITPNLTDNGGVYIESPGCGGNTWPVSLWLKNAAGDYTGTGAFAHATTTGGVPDATGVIDAGGSGYTAAPSCTVKSASGSGGTCTCTISAGAVNACSLSGGTGYPSSSAALSGAGTGAYGGITPFGGPVEISQ